ncbi:MAG: HPr kinase/phosphatase C-terminal domain-containing protein [Alphaproteobacteria bacterium]|nr:HPr kinase/phosphatase C-terminal domain-containing protein [Alphaproteobacteria bacterium]
MSDQMLIHATAVAIDGQAVLLRGFSGVGKSDLGLRLIDAGAVLIADDQCELRRGGDTVLVRCPATIAGLIELRGIGIMRVAAMEEAPLAIIADLMPSGMIERLPTRHYEQLLGVRIPTIVVAAFEPSAAIKVRMALHAFTGSGLPTMIEE